MAIPLSVALLGLTACTTHGSTKDVSTSSAPVTSPTTSPSPSPSPTKPPGPKLVDLPFGGRVVLPKYRIVAYYGRGNEKELGVLGSYSSPDAAAVAVAAQAKKYDTPTRPALPALEFIATTVSHDPGKDGNYNSGSFDTTIQPWLDAARKHGELLILDIQPGSENFLPAVEEYQKFLLQPDVGVALDAEWRMGPGQVPDTVRGHVDASEINAVTAYLSKLTVSHGLPQKVVVLHNFTGPMIANRPDVKPRAGLAIVWHFDGHGPRNSKVFGYNLFKVNPPFFNGFKLFLKEDVNIYQPSEVLALNPPPDFISYQ